MSRGLGKWQRYLLAFIRRHGQPMTFAEIEAHILDRAGAPPGSKLLPSPGAVAAACPAQPYHLQRECLRFASSRWSMSLVKNARSAG
jgi:hypothetical protein